MDLLPYQEEAAFPVRFLRNHTLSTLADVPADPRDTLGESALALAGVRELLLTRFHLCSKRNKPSVRTSSSFSLTSHQAIIDSQAQLAF